MEHTRPVQPALIYSHHHRLYTKSSPALLQSRHTSLRRATFLWISDQTMWLQKLLLLLLIPSVIFNGETSRSDSSGLYSVSGADTDDGSDQHVTGPDTAGVMNSTSSFPRNHQYPKHDRQLQEEEEKTTGSFTTTFSDYAGVQQIDTYGHMFELHVARTLKIYEMSIHTWKTDEVDVVIYTSPGKLDYLRHPTAWDWHQNVTVTGAGAGLPTVLSRAVFIPITITIDEPILSMYISLRERAMLTTEVELPQNFLEEGMAIAFQSSDISMSFGLVKMWPFAEIESTCVANINFDFARGSLPPTFSPTVSSMPSVSPKPTPAGSSPAPSEFALTVQSTQLNITSTFQGMMKDLSWKTAGSLLQHSNMFL